MQNPKKLTQGAINIMAALGTEEEMERFMAHFIAASDFHDANAEKILMHEGRGNLPRNWYFSN